MFPRETSWSWCFAVGTLYPRLEDDFDAAETVEVSYTVASGEQALEMQL